jgi:hypothetical protein
LQTFECTADFLAASTSCFMEKEEEEEEEEEIRSPYQ